MLRELLAERFPDHGVIGEEYLLHYDGDVRASAGVGLGAWRNGRRIYLREPTSPTRPEAVRLVMSARLNFMRGVDEGNIFDALARRFPNHRIYRAAYAHTIVVTGAADAMVDAHNAIWDLAASHVLIEEAGGAYTVVRDMATQDGRMLSAVFGRRDVVEQLVRLF